MVEHIEHSPKKCSASFLFFWNIGTEKLISDGSKIKNKISFGLEIFEISDDKITVFKTNFSRLAFDNLSDKDRSKFSESALNQLLFESICYAT